MKSWFTRHLGLLLIGPTLIGNDAPSGCRIDAWISLATAARASELLSAKRLEFCTAGFTETAKKVERPAICHLPQLGECLVRLQIRIDDRSFDLLSVLE